MPTRGVPITRQIITSLPPLPRGFARRETELFSACRPLGALRLSFSEAARWQPESSRMRPTLLLIAVLALPLGAKAQAPLTVIIDGVVRSIPVAAWKSIRRDTATMEFHDQPAARYEGYVLSAVLRAAGVQTDSLRGAALATRIVTESSDGYRVVLALADLDPLLGGRRVILADRMDGRALPAVDAPWRLIIVGEKLPSRSARQVLRIRVAAEPK